MGRGTRQSPKRPKLSERVAARRHVSDGSGRVILTDERDGALLEIGWREWTLLRHADGTRDVAGLVHAAAASGAVIPLESAAEFLASLAAADLVVDEPAPEPPLPRSPSPSRASEPAAPDRPLDVLPDYSLHCDASGGCCGVYPSIYFSEAETARARSAMPDVLGGGSHPERVFLPVNGNSPRGVYAVACVDGACAYLDADGRCGVHARAGARAKPAGCRLYPASFVDDGECVRVSVAAECPCVLASAGRPGGEPLVPPGARTRADLDPAAYVFALPTEVRMGEGRAVPRAQYVAWTRELLALPDAPDALLAAWRLADALDRGALEPGEVARALLDSRAISPAELYPWVYALFRAASARAREWSVFRAERDRARVGMRWLAGASEALLDARACARALESPGASEAFALRAAVHGHQLPGAHPVSHALRERAVRALVARGITAAAARTTASEPYLREPLALVNALMRGHGLSHYADELAPLDSTRR